MTVRPPAEVVKAIGESSVSITRRIEIYEADGVTPWYPGGDDSVQIYSTGGDVSVDATRDERRMMDNGEINNADGLIRIDPNNGIWYDKIIKTYRGIQYDASQSLPSIVIVEAADDNAGYQIANKLARVGFPGAVVKRSITRVEDVLDYDIVVSYTPSTRTSKAALLNSAYSLGKSVFTMGNDTAAGDLPFITSNAAAASNALGIDPVSYNTPLSGSFSSESYPADNSTLITGLDSTAQIAATVTISAQAYATIVLAKDHETGRWMHFHFNQFGTQSSSALSRGFKWLWNFEIHKNWEIQLGKFMIDKISSKNFPGKIQISGRDLTKKMLLSKIEQAESFSTGTKIRDLIIALAANSGITDMRIPTNIVSTLSSQMNLDRGTDRWSIAKEAANTQGYDLYFDNQGYLTMTPFQDPSLSPITETFQTGPEGNLASYERSTDDGRLYNHIAVYGDPGEGETRLPYFGEAKNTEPSSPTRIDRIGDRLYTYASTFFTSQKQCQDYADKLLKTSALESYDLSFDALVYPWMEANMIVKVLEPDRGATDPTRFLLPSFTIPLSLGPMSATGNRVTIVGSTGATI